jgi:large subunit ribosomal protein L3
MSARKGLFGRKVGMTQVFGPDGNRIPVTVLEVGPCPIIRIKTENGPDGYNAAVVGFGPRKAKHVNKPMQGQFNKAGVEFLSHTKEMRISAEEAAEIEAGMVLDASVFQAGQTVDVVGKTKGRGFTGVIKRHNFHEPKASHGTHEVFRHGGSLGMRTTPGRVFLGKKMAGHYGDERVTIQNLVIYSVESERNLVVVRGSVPGPNGGLLWIQEAARVATAKS